MLKIAQKPKKPEPLRLTNFRCDATTKKLMKAKADKYTNGNLTLWLAYAGTRYVPPESDLIYPAKVAD